MNQMRELLNGQSNSKPYLKSKEVREILQCSNSTLQTLRANGKLPYRDVLGTKYYAYEDVMRLFQS